MFSLTRTSHRHRGRIIQKWTFDAKSPLLSSAAAVDIDKDGKKEIIFGTKDGKIFCIDEDSNRKWEYNIRDKVGEVESFFYDAERIEAVPSTPTIKDITQDGMPEILFGTELGIIYCLNYRGKLLWEYKTEGAIRGKIMVEDVDQDGQQEILFGTSSGKFIMLNNKGKERHVFEVEGAVESEPALFTTGLHRSSLELRKGCSIVTAPSAITCGNSKRNLASGPSLPLVN
jgi:outer membrane protein assembly factor BamB